MSVTNQFLSNLAYYSEQSGHFRDDGKKLTLWNRITKFHNKTKDEHLLSVLENLTSALQGNTNITDAEKIKIFYQLSRETNKVRNKSLKNPIQTKYQTLVRQHFDPTKLEEMMLRLDSSTHYYCRKIQVSNALDACNNDRQSVLAIGKTLVRSINQSIFFSLPNNLKIDYSTRIKDSLSVVNGKNTHLVSDDDINVVIYSLLLDKNTKINNVNAFLKLITSRFDKIDSTALVLFTKYFKDMSLSSNIHDQNKLLVIQIFSRLVKNGHLRHFQDVQKADFLAQMLQLKQSIKIDHIRGIADKFVTEIIPNVLPYDQLKQTVKFAIQFMPSVNFTYIFEIFLKDKKALGEFCTVMMNSKKWVSLGVYQQFLQKKYLHLINSKKFDNISNDDLVLSLHVANFFHVDSRKLIAFAKRVNRPLPALRAISFALDQLMDRRAITCENKKAKLLRYRELFQFVDQNISNIEDKDLALKLKCQMANMPFKGDRTSFINLRLTEKDKLILLLEKTKEEENDLINKLLQVNDKKISYRLAKLLSDKSRLDPENKRKLDRTYGLVVDDETLLTLKRDNTLPTQTHQDVYCHDLKRTAKTKHFLEAQLELPEDQIFIPHWYHATKTQNVQNILNVDEIEVRHQNRFKGAWVSSKAEVVLYGPSVFAFNNSITSTPINIHYTFYDKRWRGLQTSIKLIGDSHHKGHLGILSINKKVNKPIYRERLKDKKVIVMSTAQLQHLNTTVIKHIGIPSLPNQWW